MRPPYRRLPGLILFLFASAFMASPVGAHTDFESSNPADGATIDGPLDTITLVFSGPAEPTRNGFEVLDGSGQALVPVEISSPDDSTWVLRLDPPVTAGVLGVRWTVKSSDAHLIDGDLSFTIVAPAVEPATSATTLPTQAAAGGTTSGTPPDTPADDDPSLQSDLDAGVTDIEAILAAAAPSTAIPERIGATARLVALAGTLVGVGALAFAALVLRGERRDVRHVLFWVRRAGLLVAIGAIGELVAQVALEAGGDWTSLWSGDALRQTTGSLFGIAVGLRVTGGLAMLIGPRFDLAPATEVRDPMVALAQLARVGVDRISPAAYLEGPGSSRGTGEAEWRPRFADHVWTPGTSGVAMIGAVGVVTAHLFDGHTVLTGHRFWTGLADVIHVVAGAIWVGGVAMLTAVLWRRHRHGRRLDALHLALRFSVLATASLVAVAVAGAALTVILLDSPSGLWTTEWGRTLVIKTSLVALAAGGGAYNHRVLLPQLTMAADDPELLARFRLVVTFEAAALAAVVVATAFLMGAAS